MTQKEFRLRFGALADSLEKQIDDQGFMYDREKDKYDKANFALLTLYLGDLLTVNLRALLDFYTKCKEGIGAQVEIAERLKDEVLQVEPWTGGVFE